MAIEDVDRGLVLLVSHERLGQGGVSDDAVDEAAAYCALDGWASSGAVGEGDDFRYRA